MPATEPIQGGPYPEMSDAPDGPNQMAALAVWAAGRLNMRFATTAARDAVITSPVEDMVAITGTGDTQVVWIYRSAAWKVQGIGQWAAYTATLCAGFAVGTTGVAETLWRPEGDLIRVVWRFVFGTDGTVSFASGATFSLPVTAHASEGYRLHPGAIHRAPNTHLSLARLEGATVRLTLGLSPLVNVTSTTPWGAAWQPGDTMSGSLIFRPA